MAHPTCLNILEKTSTVEKGPPVVFAYFQVQRPTWQLMTTALCDYVVFVRRLHTHPGDHGLPIWVLKKTLK